MDASHSSLKRVQWVAMAVAGNDWRKSGRASTKNKLASSLDARYDAAPAVTMRAGEKLRINAARRGKYYSEAAIHGTEHLT
jgi:hypothetical protein